jgi:hypothetical protein
MITVRSAWTDWIGPNEAGLGAESAAERRQNLIDALLLVGDLWDARQWSSIRYVNGPSC